MSEIQKKYLADFAAVREWIKDNDLPPYRSKQIDHWMCQTSIQSIDEMTDLPKPLRRQLADHFDFWSTRILRHQSSPDGTEKLLLQLAQGGSAGEAANVQFDAPSFYLDNKGTFYHTDSDTPDKIPASGLKNVVQAFAKIYDDINAVDLKDLQPPPSDRPAATSSTR